MTNDATQPTIYPRAYKLSKFTCEQCGLTGGLPNWDGPNELTQVRLAYNGITGMLPTWAGFDTLEYLDVSHNDLSGLAPPNW